MDAFFSVGGGAGGIDGMTADVGAVDVGAGGFGTGFGGGEAKTILTSVFVEGFGLLHGVLVHLVVVGIGSGDCDGRGRKRREKGLAWTDSNRGQFSALIEDATIN